MNTELSPTFKLDELICRCVQFTSTNIFLTGKAGTGKTTLLKTLTEQTHKRFAILAPTGVAAINAGGNTIHSFFQLHPHTFLPYGNFPENASVKTENPHSLSRNIRLRQDKINVLKSLDLLVIDEVSMVRCDLLDAVDTVLRRYRGNTEPFGGVQLLLIGDLYQLPPVVKDEEARMLKTCYPSFYFFESQALKRAGYTAVELRHVYRQADPVFVDLLNEIRYGKLSPAATGLLNNRLVDEPTDPEGYITLTTHVYKADQMNSSRLASLPGKEMNFKAIVEGEFNEQSFPADGLLRLKKNAQVMFVKNNREQNYFNGKIGWVESYDSQEESILVRCEKDEKIRVSRETWKNVQYTFNKDKNSVQEDQKGEFSQFPLRLAWAITIHKSQGLTFDKAIIDAGNAFAPGQVYVALSRCRNLEGIILKSRFSQREIQGDLAIDDFHSAIGSDEDFYKDLPAAQIAYLGNRMLVSLKFPWLRAAVRNFQEAIFPYLKVIDDREAEKIREWEQQMQHIITTADQYIPQIEQMLLLLSAGEIRQALIERFGRASVYFRQQLTDNFIKPLISICYQLSKIKGTKTALTEIAASEVRFREGLRELIAAEELLFAFPESSVLSIKKSMNEKLQLAYRQLDTHEASETRSHVNADSNGKKKKKKEVTGHTFNVSLELFRQGKTLTEIAFERELKPATIVSHLCRFISKGILNVHELVPAERAQLVIEEMDKIPEGTPGRFTTLAEKFTNEEISFVNASRKLEKA